MTTVNISLPEQLKKEGERLIEGGYFASFSDLIRTSLRTLLERSKYDIWAQEAREEYETGKATVLQSKKDIKKLLMNTRA